jgi:hypothetical protein
MTEVRMAEVARLGPLARGDVNGHGCRFFFHGIFGVLRSLADIEITLRGFTRRQNQSRT